MVSSLQAGTTKKQKAGLRAIDPQSHTWSVQALREACQEQGIECEESEAFSALRGVVVRCGKTIIMSIRASLEEQEKLFTIAHELAHLALNYLPSDPVVYLKDNETTPRLIQNSRKEQEVDIWAAHFLVIPEVYERCLEEAQALFPPEQALEEAWTRTAHCLNIPVRVVGLWLRSRDTHFAVAPRVWFTRGCGQRREEERKIPQAATSQDLTRPLQRQISESSSRQSAQLDEIRAGCVLKRPEIIYEYQG